TKIASENDPNTIDTRYWSSCSTVRESYACDLWAGMSPRCGLLLSSHAELGGWSSHDMGSENIPSTLQDPVAIKNYFPAHFPDIAFREVEHTLEQMDNEASELASQLLSRHVDENDENA